MSSNTAITCSMTSGALADLLMAYCLLCRRLSNWIKFQSCSCNFMNTGNSVCFKLRGASWLITQGMTDALLHRSCMFSGLYLQDAAATWTRHFSPQCRVHSQCAYMQHVKQPLVTVQELASGGSAASRTGIYFVMAYLSKGLQVFAV